MTLNVAFIGAGSRATQAHYPLVTRLHKEGVVRLEAVCDLNTERLAAAGEKFGVERRFTDYRHMLAETDLDAVYVIMPPHHSLQIVLDCLNAGKHVMVEKPPASSSKNLELMADAAERNKRVTAVGFQRRYSPIAQEIRRLVLERGPVTQCVGQFHKHLLGKSGPSEKMGGVSTLFEDVIHAVDFVRYMCGGEATEVHAFQDTVFVDWRNIYNGLVRFSTGAVGYVSGNRASGARILKFEVHGKGIYGEMEMPRTEFVGRVWADNAKQPRVITGQELIGAPEFDDDATLEVHRSFVKAIETGGETRTSFRECVGTMRLVEALEGN